MQVESPPFVCAFSTIAAFDSGTSLLRCHPPLPRAREPKRLPALGRARQTCEAHGTWRFLTMGRLKIRQIRDRRDTPHPQSPQSPVTGRTCITPRSRAPRYPLHYPRRRNPTAALRRLLSHRPKSEAGSPHSGTGQTRIAGNDRGDPGDFASQAGLLKELALGSRRGVLSGIHQSRRCFQHLYRFIVAHPSPEDASIDPS